MPIFFLWLIYVVRSFSQYGVGYGIILDSSFRFKYFQNNTKRYFNNFFPGSLKKTKTTAICTGSFSESKYWLPCVFQVFQVAQNLSATRHRLDMYSTLTECTARCKRLIFEELVQNCFEERGERWTKNRKQNEKFPKGGRENRKTRSCI